MENEKDILEFNAEEAMQILINKGMGTVELREEKNTQLQALLKSIKDWAEHGAASYEISYIPLYETIEGLKSRGFIAEPIEYNPTGLHFYEDHIGKRMSSQYSYPVFRIRWDNPKTQS